MRQRRKLEIVNIVACLMLLTALLFCSPLFVRDSTDRERRIWPPSLLPRQKAHSMHLAAITRQPDSLSSQSARRSDDYDCGLLRHLDSGGTGVESAFAALLRCLREILMASLEVLRLRTRLLLKH